MQITVHYIHVTITHDDCGDNVTVDGDNQRRQQSKETCDSWHNLTWLSCQCTSSCISRLLPPLRDSSITSRLRTPSLYPRPATRTKRYTSSNTPRSIKLPVKHTLTLPPSYLRIHSFIVILLFSLHLFYRYALWNLAILATETNKCDSFDLCTNWNTFLPLYYTVLLKFV